MTGILVAAYALPPESYSFSPLACLAFAVTMGSLSGTIFSVAFGSWFGWWRRSLLNLSFFAAFPLFLGLLLLWNLLFVLPFVALYSSDIGPSPAGVIDELFKNISVARFGQIVVVCFAACFLTRGLYGRYGWETPSQRLSSGRRRVGAVMLLGAVIATGYLTHWLQAGIFWEPGLEQHRGGSIHLLLGLGETSRDPGLPRRFLEDPDVVDVLARRERGEGKLSWARTHAAWLRAMRVRFAQPQYWRDPEAIALACFSARFYQYRITHDSAADQADEFEIALMTNLVLLDLLPASEQALELASNLDAPATTWARWLSIARSRPDLAEGPVVDSISVLPVFLPEVDKLESPQPGEKKSANGFFSAIQERRRINQAWRDFEAGLPYPRSPLLTHGERESELLNSGDRPGELDFRRPNGLQNPSRQAMIATITIMALQKQRAEGRVLTATVPPDVARLVKPYASWITLEPDDIDVQIRLKSGRGFEDDVYRVFQSEVFPVSAARELPVSPDDLAFGYQQLEQMMTDRPLMRKLVTRGDLVYEWAARHFAGASCGLRVRWDPLSPPHQWKACNNFDAESGDASIMILAQNSGASTANDLWGCAVFELINIGNGQHWDDYSARAQARQLTRQNYIDQSAKLEYLTCAKQARFYRTIWNAQVGRDDLADSQADVWWTSPPRSFEDFRTIGYGRDEYPEVPFGQRFDDIAAFRLEQQKAAARFQRP